MFMPTQSAIDPAILDTLAFSGFDEATFKSRALASREGLQLFEHELSYIRYRVIGHDPAKPTLAILPDGPATIESYDGFINTLKDRFNIAILEIPGFGFSFPKTASATGFEAGCQILTAALRTLDLPRMILVGPCIQGLFAARIAEIMGDELAGVIIAQTGDFQEEGKWVFAVLDGEALAQPFTGQIGFRLNRQKVSIDYWIPFASGPNAPVAMLQDEARKIQHAGCCYALASQVQKLGTETMPSLNVKIPAAILWGTADKSHATTDRKSVQKYAPNASYHEWEGIGHFVDIEAPEKLAESAMALLERRN
jgi:pimeloyl-ACP methyl ester carboxylesterase